MPYNWFSDILMNVGFKYDIYWAAKDGFPLWTKTVFSGMPILENAGIYATLYPFNIFFTLFQPEYIIGPIIFVHFLLVALFMYFFVKELTNNKLTSFLSSLILVFSGWFILQAAAGHLQAITGLPWMVASFYFLEKIVKNKSLKYSILFGVSLALLFLAGHVQYFIYTIAALTIYFCVKILYEPKKLKKNVIKLLISLIVTIVAILPQVLFFHNFSQYSNRSEGVDWWFATRISFPLYHLITTIMPEFFGTPFDYSYLSTSNFWNLCIYIGVFPLVLILLTFLFRRDKITMPLFILLLFSLLFSMGQYTPVYHFFYKFIPSFNFFRAPSRFLFFYVFSASVLAGIGLEKLFKLSKKNRSKISLPIIFILVAASIATIFVFKEKQLIKSFFEKEVLRVYNTYVEMDSKWLQPLSFYLGKIDRVYYHVLYGMIDFILLLTISLIIIFFSKKFAKILVFIVIAFILFDLWLFGFKYINTVPHDYVLDKTDIVNFLLNDTSNYRVLTLNESLLSQYIASKYKIQIVEGGSGVQLKNFKMFLDRIGNRSSEEMVSPMISDIYNKTLVNFLGVKYIITSKQLDGYKLVHNGSGLIYRNDDYMPRAFFVDCRGEINVKIINDSSTSISLNVSNEYPCTLVLSEVWYPGWGAYDNGKEISINKFEGALRSVDLKEGEHKIEFIYDPESFKLGLKIVIIAIVFIFSFLIILKIKSKK